MAQIPSPPPQHPPSPSIYTLPANQQLYRIFDPTKRKAQATTFRTWGPTPKGRFDHHRGINASRTPGEDIERGILYAGITFECCLLEVFKDLGVIEIAEEHLAYLDLKRDLYLLDLRSSSTAEKAGTVEELTKVVDRPLTQEWSRYFYGNPNVYTAIDGIIHCNRHNGEETVTLYERASDGIKENSEMREMRLDDALLRDAINFVSKRYKLPVERK